MRPSICPKAASDKQISGAGSWKKGVDMPKITEIYAFISEDTGPEDEGIIGQRMNDTWLPFVAADQKRIDSLRPWAKSIARVTGKKIKLIRFTHREGLEEI
jgi:hypothetical protein